MKNMLKVAMATVALSGVLATSQADAAEYQVKKGDTLWKISKQYGTSVEKIKNENHLKSNLIKQGQKLNINENKKVKSTKKVSTYKIKSGDTLYKIGMKFGVTVDQLKVWNNLYSDLIIAGDTIRVKAPALNTQIANYNPKLANQTVQVTAPAVQKVNYNAQAQTVQNVQQTVQTQPAAQKAAPVQQKTVSNSAASVATNSSVDAHLKQIMMRESGGNPAAVNPAGYYGLFQFSPTTWQAVGGTGNPAQASVDEQWKRARMLYTQYGAQHWSTAY